MATYCALLSLKSSLDDPDSRLSALRLLNLSNNVFNRTFPPVLSNLTNLRVLDLYNNNLTGVLPVSVATFHWIKRYRKGGPPGSAFTTVAQVFVAAARKWRVDETLRSDVFYKDERSKAMMAVQHQHKTLARTNQIRYLSVKFVNY
ncbi:hypothetical protein ACLB2K_077412 [Fragaria x ananassa]